MEFVTGARKILIIGNGFDIAHNLPTKYTEFLDYAKSHITDQSTPYHTHLNDNFWFEYLWELRTNSELASENWIDFEREIRLVIHALDSQSQNLLDIISITKLKSSLAFTRGAFINSYIYNLPSTRAANTQPDINFKTFRKRLHEDLARLTYALEYYLLNISTKTLLVSFSPDIKTFAPTDIISFNYTHTYQSVYSPRSSPSTHYIHGECNQGASQRPCNLVLGVDEYWVDNRRNTDTNYSVFKKYVQRIQKDTYKSYYSLLQNLKRLDQINSGRERIAEVVIFGHSLDTTDKDILEPILSNPRVDVTVYCFDESTQGEYIANTIRLITQDRFFEKINSFDPTLRFIIQQPMAPIE